MKIIGKTTEGNLLIEAAAAEMVALDVASRRILGAVGQIRVSLIHSSGAPAAPAAATPPPKSRRGRPPVRNSPAKGKSPTGRAGAKGKAPAAPARREPVGDLPFQHCPICKQNYRPRRRDQTKHGKTCPGNPVLRASAPPRETPATPPVSPAARRIAAMRASRPTAAQEAALKEARELQADRTEGLV
jgi:hypothetical protein